jgi:hypothetical protein
MGAHSMIEIEKLISCLNKSKKTGENKWLACCPAHDDRNPSLAIKYVDNKILLHCFAGCGIEEIVNAIGLEMADLMPDKPTRNSKHSAPPKFNKYELFDKVISECSILCVAIRHYKKGVILSSDDLARVQQAEQTIDDIIKEVRS